MNPITRQRWLFLIAMAILAFYAMLSVGASRRAAQRLATAQSDLVETKEKLRDVERLKTAPKVAALQLEAPAEITNRISAAREVAGLPQSSLLRQEPQEPQRIGRSDFEQRSTTITLSALTMKQIIEFCDALRDEQTGTIVRDLTLSNAQTRQSKQNNGGPEKWEAEMTLTQMIFSPKSQ
ncbi:hypothetical protein Pla22_03430 [Rubripirellula amarantea]|uniref:General secretion pathway protein M n=1 Tax=Rubripirellula amarantea TaxID=2527999 RepID=A0A5C5WQA7_9BACT|nr:hypothetical protein [Rubripirellula amarantea]TWT52717.1 hypothetical protein Pla22_03430 [Rubripirellula amarantea]